MINVGELKKGLILKFDENLYEVVNYELFKLGKGNSEARIRIRLKDLRSGMASEKVFQTSDKLPRVFVESHPVGFLYEDGDMFYFMDQESFEQIVFTREQLVDITNYLKEGITLEVLTYKDKPVTIRLPITVELKVVETGPGFKGDTASAGGKPAKVETGLIIQVPFFINVGDRVKVDTRTGEYLERVA